MKIRTGTWKWGKLDNGDDCIIARQTIFGFLFGREMIIFGDDIKKVEEE